MLRLHPSPLKCFTAILILALSLVCAAGANAQSTYGTLLGAVRDTSGAVVAGAVVTVTETRTNISKTVTSDGRGDYQLPNLPAGIYNVTIAATGFKQFLRRGVPLDPRAEVRVDASLQVGETHTTVEVTGSAPVIATETATVDDVTKGKEIAELPINYRANSTSPFYAITTIPGVQVDSGGALGSASFSVSGNHPSQNEVSVDGFSVTSPRSNGPIAEMFPSTEQISELKVTSQIANAEYGQVGDIAFIGKNGTNTYHGSAFEYIQNDAFDATTPVLDASPGSTPNAKARKRNNDFGGSFAGPLQLPFYNGRDHTFFFVDYERNVQRSESTFLDKVPTPGMLGGDFSFLLPGIQLTNPFTGAPFVNNQIPTTMLNPTSLKILDRIFPAPTVPNVDPTLGDSNYIVNLAAPVTTDLYDIRIDRVLTKKQSLFGRFSWKKSISSSPQELGTKTGSIDSSVDPKAFVLSHNYTIRQNLLNELRFGINKQRSLSTFSKFPDGAALIADLGLQQLGTLPHISALPDFNFNGQSGLTSSPGGRANTLREKKIQIADNLTWIRGRHTIKTGFDLRTLSVAQTESFITADNFGDYSFSDQYTGYDFADFLLGLPSSTQIVAAGPDFDGHARAYAFFGQDSFKVTPKLTIEFGLRYEYHPPFHDNTLQIANFDRSNGSVVVPNAASLALATPGFLQSINACSLLTPNPPVYGNFPCTPVITAAQDHIPASLRKSDKRKFLPRLGMAYRLNGKTVVRAGAGLYDETLLGTIFYSLTGIHTSAFQAFSNTPGFPSTPAIVFPNTKSNNVSNGSGPAGDAVFGTANQIDLRDPYGEQWSLTVERDLGFSTGLRVTYTGLRSVGLILSPDLNQIHAQTIPYDPTEKPFPNWNFVKTRDNGGYSFYNGLETVVTHRFSSGFFFQSSWVWSKNLSNAEGDDPNAGFAGENGPRITDRFNLRRDYGDVTYTRRHRWLTNANFDLPFGRGRKFGSHMNRFLEAVLGGWRNSDILVIQTGPFLTPHYSGNNDPSGTNVPIRPGTDRPDIVPLSVCDTPAPDEHRAFQGKCFFYGWGVGTNPANIGRFGNAGVGILHGAGTVVWNTGLAKNFTLTERFKLRFESTFTNALNHVNPGPFDTTANSDSFGTISSPQSVEGTGARDIQFGLRLDF